jgi:hypothetical protein
MIYYPNSILTVPNSINDKGAVVGFYWDKQTVQHGFILENGIYKTLDNPKNNPHSVRMETCSLISTGRVQSVGFYYIWGNHLLVHLRQWSAQGHSSKKRQQYLRCRHQRIWGGCRYHHSQFRRPAIVHGALPMNRAHFTNKLPIDAENNTPSRAEGAALPEVNAPL